MEISPISILVIDDDPTCLSIVAGHLQQMNHHVVALKNPIDALCMLRMRIVSFDLILTDVHMPEMSGLDLLRHVDKEFNLPVVLMSADCDKDMMLKGLEDGASFYILKPISKKSLATIWQFAITSSAPNSQNIISISSPNKNPLISTIIPPSKTTNALVFEPTINGSNTITTTTTTNTNANNIINTNVILNYFEGRKSDTTNYNFVTLKRPGYDAGFNGYKGNLINKKPKMVWTTTLHNLFLEAIQNIGIERAVPKKILEYMNVPWLRRENVASHLQKYRIFLKRIAEFSNSYENGVPINWNERPLRSSFVLNEITFLTNNFQQQYEEILAHQGHKKGKGQSSIQAGISFGEVHPRYKNIINRFSNSDTEIHPNKGIFGNKTTNYVGLRISADGQLVGPLIDSLLPTTASGGSPGVDSVNNKGKCDVMANKSVVVQEVTDNNNTTNNTSFNNKNNNNLAQNVLASPLFGMDGEINLGGFDNNVNVYIPEFDQASDDEQESLFGASNEMLIDGNDFSEGLRQVGNAFNFDQGMLGDNFGFESFAALDDGIGFNGMLDQALFFNDDICFENYFAQEIGQQNPEEITIDRGDENFTNSN